MTSEEILPALLVEGEPLIPAEKLEQYKDIIEKVNIESAEDASVITAPNKPGAGGKKESSLGGVADNNVIGLAEKKKTAKPSAKAGQKKATVAIYSERNLRWSNVGEISKGYNIVTKEQAEKWLTRKHVREATPEEVASEYGA